MKTQSLLWTSVITEQSREMILIYWLTILAKCFLPHCLKSWYASKHKPFHELSKAKTKFSGIVMVWHCLCASWSLPSWFPFFFSPVKMSFLLRSQKTWVLLSEHQFSVLFSLHKASFSALRFYLEGIFFPPSLLVQLGSSNELMSTLPL